MGESAEYEIQDQGILDINDCTSISLLSGGLDSFCGAFATIDNGEKTKYCSYKTGNIDASYINKVFEFIKTLQPDANITVFKRLETNKITYTQRTRSLLFLTLAVLVAAHHKVDIVRLYENGIMTLNPSFQSRGTTKTTHPKTIKLYQSLLKELGISIKIEHPFLFSTKGELLRQLNGKFKDMIRNTHSCGRSRDPRYKEEGLTSCGTCVPCMLRKISLAAYDMEGYDHEYFVPYERDVSDPEYRSSLMYFRRFLNSIRNNEIFSELDIRPSYYEEEDALNKTYRMLNVFAVEIETYLSKYGG